MWFPSSPALGSPDRSKALVATSPAAGDSSPAPDLMRTAIAELDGLLRRRQHMFEYSRNPRCLLRVARTSAAGPLRLADGIEVGAGDLILDLHLWNEHIPRMPGRGPTWAWAAEFLARLAFSLAELAEQLAKDPALSKVKAVHARFAFAPRKRSSCIKIALRLGFETLQGPPPAAPVHDFGENLWLWGLAWTFNPGSLHRRRLSRDREDLWMSASRLIALYGPRTSAASDGDG